MADDHAPDRRGDPERHPETMFGEWRDGRPEGGVRFPERADAEPRVDDTPGERPDDERDGEDSSAPDPPRGRG